LVLEDFDVRKLKPMAEQHINIALQKNIIE
jgi:hypothetical protein